jgi:flagellar basal body-associated protein FliL
MVESDGTSAAGQAADTISASAADVPVGAFAGGAATLSRTLPQLFRNKLALAMVALPASLLLASAILALFLGDNANEPPAVTVTIAGATSYHELPEFLADLRSSRARMHYVQLAAVVEVTEDSLDQLQAQQTHIIAGVQMALRDLRKQDLAGAAGVERLRSILASIVDHHIAPASVSSVLFTKFLVD